MKYYLGIDGGGTSTRLLIMDQNKSIKSFRKEQTLNIYQIGREKVAELLPYFIEDVCKDANILITDIQHAFLTFTGYREVEQDTIFFDELASKLFTNVTCGNDIESAWAGSLATQEGIHIICGTGSIAYGRNSKGQDSRCGGWGHFFGDEASGYWLGHQVLNLFSKQSDGRVKRGFLWQNIRDKFNISNDFDIITLYEQKLINNKSEIASLAPVLFDSIQNGDQSAYELLEQNIKEMVLMIETVKNSLEWETDIIPVSYSGGVFNRIDIIEHILKKELQQISLDLHTPILTPIIGSVYYAYILDGNHIDLDDVNKLSLFNSKYC